MCTSVETTVVRVYSLFYWVLISHWISYKLIFGGFPQVGGVNITEFKYRFSKVEVAHVLYRYPLVFRSGIWPPDLIFLGLF